MSRIVTTLRQFIQLLVKEIALCGEHGAPPIRVAQNTIATFCIERLEFANNEPFEALRACWDALMSMKDEIFIGPFFIQARNSQQRRPRTLEDAIEQNFLLFASTHAQLFALGQRPWISSFLFDMDKASPNKYLSLLKSIAMARQKGVLTTTLAQELGMNSYDIHYLLNGLESSSLVSSRKCQMTIDDVRTCSNLWHLASLPAASLPLAGDAFGDITVICPCVSEEHLDLCMHLLQNAGGTIAVDDFANQLSQHPQLEDSGVLFSQGQGFSRLEEVLTQHRNVRRVLVFQPSSRRYKVPALQIYEPGQELLPKSSYAFHFLHKVPPWLQVQSFIHECGSAGCTIADIHERLRIPYKPLQKILDHISTDEIDATKQSIGRSRVFVYRSKITSAQPPCVFKVGCELDLHTTVQQHIVEPNVSSLQPVRAAASRNVPWEDLNLNDLQSKRLDIMHTHLLLNRVVSLSILYSHVMEQERLSNYEYIMSNRTFVMLVATLLPFVKDTHVQRSVIMGDGVTVTMLLPSSMSASDPAVAEAYSRHCSSRKSAITGKKIPLLLGSEPQPAPTKRRKAVSATSAAKIEENDIGDAPDAKSAAIMKTCDDSDNSNDSRDCPDDNKSQYAYRKLLGIPSYFIRAYLLHSFIMSRGLQTVSADALISMLPIKLLIKIVGIPSLKNDVLFKLFQELRLLPAHAMDCVTFPRKSVLKTDRRHFLKAWNLLLKFSILKRQQMPAFVHGSSVILTQEFVASRSIIIDNVDPETFDKFSQFGGVYYEPGLCVFSLQNDIELRQLWTFLKHLAPHIDSNKLPDPNIDQSLPDSHRLPDILRCGGVFRLDYTTAPVKKRSVGWALFRFSGPIVTKLSNFLKESPDLQGILETKVFPHTWLSEIVPQVLANELCYDGLEIFIEYKRVYNQQAKVQLILGGNDDGDEDAEAVQASAWNLELESKLLSFVLLHNSDSFCPGLTPSQEDLDRFCKLVNWQVVSRFVHQPAVVCQKHFLQLVPCSHFATALQAVREKYPGSAANPNRTVTAQMAQDLSNDIRAKILIFSDSFFWQQRDSSQGQDRGSFASTTEPPKVLLPWQASFSDCLAAGLVMKRTLYADHYDPAVAAATKDIDSLLAPDQVLAGSSCLASFGATLCTRGSSQVLRWSNVPKVVSEKLKVDKAPPNRASVLQMTEDFQNGVKAVPPLITNVSSSVDAAALAVLHMWGRLSFEHVWRIDAASEPVVQSNKKISILDYLQNQGILRPMKSPEQDAEAADVGVDSQLPDSSDRYRFMYRLNDPDVKIFKRPRHAIADLDLEPSSWKTDFPPETVEEASAFVHRAATGVDVRLLCNSVGIDVDDALAFRRHLLSGMRAHFF